MLRIKYDWLSYRITKPMTLLQYGAIAAKHGPISQRADQAELLRMEQ